MGDAKGPPASGYHIQYLGCWSCASTKYLARKVDDQDTMRKTKAVFQRQQSHSDETSLWQSLLLVAWWLVAVVVTADPPGFSEATFVMICLVACHWYDLLSTLTCLVMLL